MESKAEEQAAAMVSAEEKAAAMVSVDVAAAMIEFLGCKMTAAEVEERISSRQGST